MSTRYAKHQAITLAGGGELRGDTLTRALSLAPYLVAADGGADRAIALGHTPEQVIGDLDSVSESVRATLGPKRVQHVTTQDDTDFDKALSVIGAPLIIGVGFSGGRLDHTLAAMNTLVRHAGRKIVLDTGHDLCVVLPPVLELSLPADTRVSLFPMTPVRCTSTGLHWPIEGLPFDPAGKIGTSNKAVGGLIRLTADTPGMLLIVPPAFMDALLAGYVNAPLWPAPVPAR